MKKYTARGGRRPNLKKRGTSMNWFERIASREMKQSEHIGVLNMQIKVCDWKEKQNAKRDSK